MISSSFKSNISFILRYTRHLGVIWLFSKVKSLSLFPVFASRLLKYSRDHLLISFWICDHKMGNSTPQKCIPLICNWQIYISQYKQWQNVHWNLSDYFSSAARFLEITIRDKRGENAPLSHKHREQFLQTFIFITSDTCNAVMNTKIQISTIFYVIDKKTKLIQTGVSEKIDSCKNCKRQEEQVVMMFCLNQNWER